MSHGKQGPILPDGFPSKEPKSDRCIPWNTVDIVEGKPMLKYFDENSGWIV